ncbi:MAG: hypothetical protein IPN42_03035 [Methylococcaceae bacterium]|nr:hypothetical protein [Methylococcaceae bacterium]
MEIKYSIITSFLILVVTCQANADNRSNETISTIAGIYILNGHPKTSMRIIQDNKKYHIELEGGGDDSIEGNVSADCIIHANGIVKGKKLTATFTAVDMDTFSYTNKQAEEEKRKIKIRFRRSQANVYYIDSLGYCGYGADFSGIYQRKK